MSDDGFIRMNVPRHTPAQGRRSIQLKRLDPESDYSSSGRGFPAVSLTDLSPVAAVLIPWLDVPVLRSRVFSSWTDATGDNVCVFSSAHPYTS